VDESAYRRTISIEGKSGVIEVTSLAKGSALELSVRFPDPRALFLIVERVRRLFDLGCDPAVIAEHLGADPGLREALANHAGIRAPGAWDGFELAVTALLGPRMAGRLAATFGSPVAVGLGLDRLFPTARELSKAPIEQAGVGTARAEAIRALARQGGLSSWLASHAVDESTAEYVAMRALGEPDAFPSPDPRLRRNAERWRPWRAYAFMLLWQEARDIEGPRRMGHAQSGLGRPVSVLESLGAS
jgi:AraC family transcriptional regulator of adaptative response / DNA-3-methyladenine glycosylase II